MKHFITFDVVSYTPEQRVNNPKHEENARLPADEREQGIPPQITIPAKVNTFPMYVRPHLVAGVNVVDEGPTPEVKSIVYFLADAGMKPMLSCETTEELLAKLDA